MFFKFLEEVNNREKHFRKQNRDLWTSLEDGRDVRVGRILFISVFLNVSLPPFRTFNVQRKTPFDITYAVYSVHDV